MRKLGANVVKSKMYAKAKFRKNAVIIDQKCANNIGETSHYCNLKLITIG